MFVVDQDKGMDSDSPETICGELKIRKHVESPSGWKQSPPRIGGKLKEAEVLFLRSHTKVGNA